ncbi:MAG TPA: NfeD family protein [Gaiellaceae bacterium]
MLLIAVLVVALLFLPQGWGLAAVAAAAVCEVAFWVVGIRYSRRRRSDVGVQTLVGREAEAISALSPAGQVKVGGEVWEARAPSGARAGETLRITRVDGLTLEVEPAAPRASQP